jgi:hypothetical protein
MMAFGVALLACVAVGWLFPAAEAARSGLLPGVAMLACGVAAAQGRTSLRKTGLFAGIILPALIAGFYAWRALDAWRAGSGMVAVTVLTMMSAAGLLTLLILMKLRVGDSIGERGYSVLPTTPTRSNPHPAPPERVREP